MDTRNAMRNFVIGATLASVSVVAIAQQNQTQANQNPNQNPPQNQQAQPQQKKSFWQKVQAVTQQGQNTVQQGSNTVQQASQQVQNGAQQGVQGVQQGAQNALQGNQGNGAFSGGGANTSSCGPSCFDAGPFQANVAQMTMSQEGGWHVIRMNVQFHNASNQPLIIAYHDGSMVMVDNNGNTYIPAGGNPGQLQGMGIDRGTQTDSQFQLAPGQTGNALFSVARGRAANSPVGTGYSYNLTIDELQLQNGAMAIPVRTYNLNFPSLVPGTSNASAFASGSSPVNGFVGAGRGANSVGNTVPQGGTQMNATPRGVMAPAQQQRMVNAKPTPGTPAAVVNNAAMRTPVNAPRTATPPAPVKPIPATATTKATVPLKKTTSATTTSK